MSLHNHKDDFQKLRLCTGHLLRLTVKEMTQALPHDVPAPGTSTFSRMIPFTVFVMYISSAMWFLNMCFVTCTVYSASVSVRYCALQECCRGPSSDSGTISPRTRSSSAFAVAFRLPHPESGVSFLELSAPKSQRRPAKGARSLFFVLGTLSVTFLVTFLRVQKYPLPSPRPKPKPWFLFLVSVSLFLPASKEKVVLVLGKAV